MLKASREAVPEGKPLDPTLLHDGFLRVNNKKKKHIQKLNPKLFACVFLFTSFYIFQFEEIFRPYSRYCSEQTNCQEYCREQDRSNEIFKAYLAVSSII